MKAKFIFIALALFFAVGTAQAYIPTIEADTIFKGFSSGVVSRLVFANEGKSVIVMRDGTPVEIDIETHQILREFEAVPNATSAAARMYFDKRCNYLTVEISSSLIDGKTNFTGTVVWDYATSKIIKTLKATYFFSNDEHTYMWNKSDGNIYEYDPDSFRKLDSSGFKIDYGWQCATTWQNPVNIPNTDQIVYDIYLDRADNYGGREFHGTLIYVIDFKTNQFREIYPKTNTTIGSKISSIKTTATGKYSIVDRDACHYIFLDCNLNYLYEIKSDGWKESNGLIEGNNPFLNTTFGDDYALFNITTTQGRKIACLNIAEKKVYKYLGFIGTAIYDRETKKLAVVNSKGVIALFDDEMTPVQETPKLTKNTIYYKEGTLVYETSESGKMDIVIVDYLGNTIWSQSEVYMNSGENRLPITTRLSNGVYFCIVKSLSGTQTYKFMVY